MHIISSENRDAIILRGKIEGELDYSRIKLTFGGFINRGEKSIFIRILHAKTLPLDVLGYWLKLINKDKVMIKIEVADDELFRFLHNVGLTEIMNVSMARKAEFA